MNYRNYLEEIIYANTNLLEEEVSSWSIEELEFYCGF